MYDLEPAVVDFEGVCGCQITVHDLARVFVRKDSKPMLDERRASHRQTYAECAAEERDYCVAHCMFEFNRRVNESGRPYYLKRCRSGLIEVAIPLYRHQNQVATLFAGLWKHPLDASGGGEGRRRQKRFVVCAVCCRCLGRVCCGRRRFCAVVRKMGSGIGRRSPSLLRRISTSRFRWRIWRAGCRFRFRGPAI